MWDSESYLVIGFEMQGINNALGVWVNQLHDFSQVNLWSGTIETYSAYKCQKILIRLSRSVAGKNIPSGKMLDNQ